MTIILEPNGGTFLINGRNKDKGFSVRSCKNEGGHVMARFRIKYSGFFLFLGRRKSLKWY